MKLYLDSSALVKLVKKEAESNALRRFLRGHRTDGRVTSALARVEVVRALATGGPSAIAQARRQLARVDQVNLQGEILDDAASLLPGSLVRTLDALHLASARSIGADLRAVVTYDRRMRDAAIEMGLATETPD